MESIGVNAADALIHSVGFLLKFLLTGPVALVVGAMGGFAGGFSLGKYWAQYE